MNMAWFYSLPACPSDPFGRFGWLMLYLRSAMGSRVGLIAPPLMLLIDRRLSRMARIFAATAARFQAGTLRPPRPRAPRPEPAPQAPPRPPYERLPGGFGWLNTQVPGYAPYVGDMALRLLAEPEMQALLAAAPQLGRILRPLCRMSGVRPAPGLIPPPPARPRRPRAARPAKPVRATAAPDSAPPPLPTFRTRGGQLMMKLSESISVPVVAAKNRA
jgi:hypothetical protein